jgi:acetyl esterase/lipase
MSKEQRAQVDAMLRRPQPPGPQPIEAMRAGFEALMSQMIVPDTVAVTRTTLGDRRALLVAPDGPARSGTILYFHGGSFSLGSPETGLSLTGNLVARTGIRAFSVDYRLAPEHPFPAAIDDGLGAYRALVDSGEDPASIAFAGDSAGGNVAVSTCLAAREAGLPLPAAVVAFSPGLDLSRSGASVDTKAGIDPSSPARASPARETCTSPDKTRSSH